LEKELKIKDGDIRTRGGRYSKIKGQAATSSAV